MIGLIGALSRAQATFSVALGLAAAVITWFAIFVAGSTMWGDRWLPKKKR